MFGLGTQELIIIFLIVLVIFGATRLPEMGKGIGLAIRNFRKSLSDQEKVEGSLDKSSEQSSAEESLKK